MAVYVPVEGKEDGDWFLLIGDEDLVWIED